MIDAFVIGNNTSQFVTDDFNACALNWRSVFDTVLDNSGGDGPWDVGGGGGNFVGEAIASAILVTDSSSCNLSGAVGETINPLPLNKYQLALDTVAAKVKWVEPPFVIVEGVDQLMYELSAIVYLL